MGSVCGMGVCALDEIPGNNKYSAFDKCYTSGTLSGTEDEFV